MSRMIFTLKADKDSGNVKMSENECPAPSVLVKMSENECPAPSAVKMSARHHPQ